MDFAAIIQALSTMNSLQLILVVIILILLSNSSKLVKFIKSRGKKEEKNVHHGCKNFHNLEFIIQRYVDRAIKIERIKSSILPSQMVAVDKSSIKVKSILMDTYKKLKAPHQDVYNYDNILFKTMSSTQELLRDWVKKNHLLDKTDIEFREYVRETKDLIIKHHIAELDREYNSEFFTVNRAKLLNRNKEETIGKIDDELEELLYKIRDIVSDKMKEIDKLQVEDFFE